MQWKTEQGNLYEENISNLRWEIDFKANLNNNLAKIEDWLHRRKVKLHEEKTPK